MCERRARQELAGLGDPAGGEWAEWNPDARVFHLRRRLTAAEAAGVGPVRDVRGTAEAAARINALPAGIRARIPAEALAAELGPV